jgi:anti-sigma factor RsiW
VTNTSECRAFEADLSALIDGELPREREAQVRAHLAGCAACSRRLEALRRVDVALAELPQPAVSPRLAQQVSNRLRDLEPGRAPARQAGEAGAQRAEGERRRAPAGIAPPRARRRWLSARTAIASAAAAAALVLWVSRRGAEEPAPGAQVARAPVPAEAPAQTVPVERAPTPEPPSEPAAVVAKQRGAAPPAAPELGDLEDQDVLLLMRLEEVEDFDMLANLELVEAMVAASAREGSG